MSYIDSKNVYKCVMCGAEVSDVPSKVTDEELEVVYKKAQGIIESHQESTINLRIKVGGKWAKTLLAIKTLMIEGLGMEETHFYQTLLRAGILGMANVFGSMQIARANFESMAKAGILEQDTVDRILRDMGRIKDKGTQEE